MTETTHDDAAASAAGEPASPFDAEALVASARWTFDEGRTRSLEWRYAQLDALAAMLTEHGDRFSAALASDLGKSATEADPSLAYPPYTGLKQRILRRLT